MPGCYNLRDVQTDESKASRLRWQFDCSYSRDKVHFILELSALCCQISARRRVRKKALTAEC